MFTAIRAEREASRQNIGGFQNFKTSLQVKLLGLLFCLISLHFTAVLELYSVGFCQVKLYFKAFWSTKNLVAIFSCQSLLLGTNVPNDRFAVNIHAMISEWQKLQSFHIWFGFMVQDTISKCRRLHYFYNAFALFLHCSRKWPG